MYIFLLFITLQSSNLYIEFSSGLLQNLIQPLLECLIELLALLLFDYRFEVMIHSKREFPICSLLQIVFLL
jgi:hypothetical protein